MKMNNEIYKKNLEEFLKKLNIKFKNIDYYINALTHSSYAYEKDTVSNERLEFLGDAILELLSTDYLFKKYDNDFNEGQLTKTRAEMVCENSLYTYSIKLGLEKQLRLGNGEIYKGPRKSMIADAFEALIAAIYLDLGLLAAFKFFNKYVVNMYNHFIEETDYKTVLQEAIQENKNTLKYVKINENGPAHNKTFEICVYLNDTIKLGCGIGNSKKEAEKNAAKEALNKAKFKID